MNDIDPAVQSDITDQHVKSTLDLLRDIARQFAGRPQNEAAVDLAGQLAGMVSPDVLANTLANLLLDQLKMDEARQQIATGPDRETVWCELRDPRHEGAHFDTDDCLHPHYTDLHTRVRLNAARRATATNGVEIRVIGPEPACKEVLGRMYAGGVPSVGPRGPLTGEHRPGTVRFYSYTDQATADACRGRGRRGNQFRPGQK